MTREEEILNDQNLSCYVDKKRGWINEAFLDGVLWADRTMVDKVCKWMDNINTDDYMDSGIFQMYNLISDLRKAMEEQL